MSPHGVSNLILIRPEEEKDGRGESTVQAIKDLSRQIDSSIAVDIHRVDHRDFGGMVISKIGLLKNAEGPVNLSGGPREIFLAFVVACISQSKKIFKTTNMFLEAILERKNEKEFLAYSIM